MKKITKNDLRIVFMGTQFWAAEILKSLLDDKYNIISIYTQSGKKNKTREKFNQSPVREMAEKNHLKIFEPDKFDEAVIDKLKNQSPDIILVVAYGKILPQKVLDIPKLGAINVHPSLLPKFRGPSPVQNAILKGEARIGTTIMLMDKGIDSGDILNQMEISIESTETFPEILEKITKKSSALLMDTIPLWVEGKINPQKQNSDKSTYCRMIRRDDGKIDWNMNALSIYNRWRAFLPWPGIFSFWKNKEKNERIKLIEIEIAKNISSEEKIPGQVFFDQNNVYVRALSGSIRIKKIQPEGKPVMSIENFLNGHKDFLSSFLE